MRDIEYAGKEIDKWMKKVGEYRWMKKVGVKFHLPDSLTHTIFHLYLMETPDKVVRLKTRAMLTDLLR